MPQPFPTLRSVFVRVAVATTVSLLAVVSSAFAGANADSTPRPTQDTSAALVQLKGDPLATSARTRPAPGRKIDFNNSAVKAYRAQLSALRNDYKAWLRANVPQARVTGEFDISLNAVAVQLNGASLAQVAASNLVRTAQYQGLYYPIDNSDPDLSLILAQNAWAVTGGAANAGRGAKVAIVDTGIDITHPCFSDAGYGAQAQMGDRRFTNNKVISAKVFNNKIPAARYTAEAIQSHGTHVAGTVACNLDTSANVDGVAIPYAMSGVAPAALLGNYNIFPGPVESARSEDILDALEAAYADGFDVANMSLGGGASGIQDLLTVAVDNLDVADMVVAVAAGNSGPGHYTVESPGSAARALTAGASTVPHFIGAPITTASLSTGGATGDFQTVSSDLTAPLGVVTGSVGGLGTACSALPANSLAGSIAVLSRGTCTFSTKIRNAQAAGAVAVLVVNNVAGDPVAMGSDGTADQPTAPAYMVSLATRSAFVAASGASTTIGATLSYIASSNSNIMAGFSSQGPTDVDFRVKPDVVAPGVNVLSSIPHTACGTPPCFALFQGTSMATPHLAGSAAVLRAAYPGWSAADIRSAIVNTASQGVLRDFQTGASAVGDVNIVGAGLENLLAAAGAAASIDPVSLSFGAVPWGSGQPRTSQVTLRNLGTTTASWNLAVSDGDGALTYTLSSSSVSVAPGASATITVTMAPLRGAAVGGHSAMLRVSAGSTEVAHAVLYTLIK